MATATADNPMSHAIGEHSSVPVIANDIVYEGSAVGDNAAGYGRPLVAGDKFLGHATRNVNNTAGAAGDLNIETLTGRYKLEVALAGYITDVGQPVYMSDDTTYTFLAPSNSYVGVVARYVSASRMVVEFRPGEYDEFGNNANRELKSDNYTALLADSGKIIYVDTDTKVITLTAIATLLSGYELTVVNAAGDGLALIAVDPTTDLISGGCSLGAGGGGKQFRNTKLTARRGDYIKIAGNATGWNIIGLRGTWAIES